jgi:hypothetical protein
MTPPKDHHWLVTGFENGCAVLKLGDQVIRVSRRHLPKTVKEGDLLAAEFYFASQEKLRRESIARALLEELLKPE